MRYLLYFLGLIALALRCSDPIVAQGRGGGDQVDPIVGAWFNPKTRTLISFNRGGLFIDYGRRVTGATWMTVDENKLRIADQTFGLTLGDPSPTVCGYLHKTDDDGQKNKARAKSERGSSNELKEKLELQELRDVRGCDLAGEYRRMVLDRDSPLIGKWFNNRSRSVIEFTSGGHYIVHDKVKVIVGVEVMDKVVGGVVVGVELVEGAIRQPRAIRRIEKFEEASNDVQGNRKGTRDTEVSEETLFKYVKAGRNFEVLGVVKEVMDVDYSEDAEFSPRVFKGAKVVVDDRGKKFIVVDSLSVYDSVSRVVLPGEWMIGGYVEKQRMMDRCKGTVGITNGGFGTPSTGVCDYKIDTHAEYKCKKGVTIEKDVLNKIEKDTLTLSQCTHSSDDQPPATLTRVARSEVAGCPRPSRSRRPMSCGSK